MNILRWSNIVTKHAMYFTKCLNLKIFTKIYVKIITGVHEDTKSLHACLLSCLLCQFNQMGWLKSSKFFKYFRFFFYCTHLCAVANFFFFYKYFFWRRFMVQMSICAYLLPQPLPYHILKSKISKYEVKQNVL